MRKSDINELFGLEIAMEVGCFDYWFGDYHTGCVDCLPNILGVYSSSYFFDQEWSKFFATKLLVYTKEIDFDNFHGLIVQIHLDRDSRNKANKFFGLFRPNSQVPVLNVSWNK
jgi:hypothetical protein